MQKIDKGSDSSCMPINICKLLFPKVTVEQLLKHRDKKVILCTCNMSKIMQLGVCSVKERHKNKDKLC